MNIKLLIKKLLFKSNINFLNEKDIVWAKRYDNEKEKLSIKEGHRESPYIIVKTTKRKVYGIECTTNCNVKESIISKYPLASTKYSFLKDCYANLERIVILNKYRYIKTLGKLEEEDLEKIKRALNVINNNEENKLYKKLKIKIDIFKVGDFINRDGTLYYISSTNKDYYKCKEVNKSPKSKNRFNINGEEYSIKISSEKQILKNQKITLINFANEIEQKKIKKFEEETKRKALKKCQYGDLIKSTDDSLYYIYGEYKRDLLVIKVYENKINKKGLIKITIENNVYYTLFEKYIIKKSLDIKIVKIASLDERKYINKFKANRVINVRIKQ